MLNLTLPLLEKIIISSPVFVLYIVNFNTIIAHRD